MPPATHQATPSSTRASVSSGACCSACVAAPMPHHRSRACSHVSLRHHTSPAIPPAHNTEPLRRSCPRAPPASSSTSSNATPRASAAPRPDACAPSTRRTASPSPSAAASSARGTSATNPRPASSGSTLPASDGASKDGTTMNPANTASGIHSRSGERGRSSAGGAGWGAGAGKRSILDARVMQEQTGLEDRPSVSFSVAVCEPSAPPTLIPKRPENARQRPTTPDNGMTTP